MTGKRQCGGGYTRFTCQKREKFLTTRAEHFSKEAYACRTQKSILTREKKGKQDGLSDTRTRADSLEWEKHETAEKDKAFEKKDEADGRR